MATTNKILALEDSTEYVRRNMGTEYPSTKAENMTISNIPRSLHAELKVYASANKITMYEMIAGLWDFTKEYEAQFAEELAAQRKR